MPKTKPRKRPCKICRRWFLPNVRHIDRQKTCGAECRTELHRRQCEQLNQRNKESAKANYLQNKLQLVQEQSCNHPTEKTKPNIARPRINLCLPRRLIQETIGAQSFVIIDYIVEQIVQRHKHDNLDKRLDNKAIRAPDHRDASSSL